MQPTYRSAPGARWLSAVTACVITTMLSTTGPLRAQCETSTGVQHRASDGGSQDNLGRAVAVSGDFALLGAPGHPEFTSTGAVYVLGGGSGSWSVTGKLTASDGAPEARFGSAVALDGQWGLIGAEGVSAAYLFRNDGGHWTEHQKLVPPESASAFGFSVALSGSTAVVGAYGALSFSGKAYVYTFDGSSWTHSQTLSAPDAAAYDFFGAAVAACGDVIVVGAYGEDTGGTNAGSVYVFRGTGGEWTYEQTLRPGDRAAGDSFGRSVSCWDNVLVAGSPRHASTGTNAGAVYVYWNDGTSWVADGKLVGTDTAPGDRFGSSVSIHDSVLLVGSPFWDDETGITDRGAAYPFVDDGDGWQEGSKLLAFSPYGWYDDTLGNAVAAADGVAVVAAQLADGPGRDAGHVYTFDMQCTTSAPECANASDCNDSDLCTTDTCDNGACVYAYNNVPCDDGDACTDSDVCSEGLCAGAPIDCDDGIACTADRCEAGSCVYDAAACECASNVDCDDGNPCTGDQCDGGSCSHINVVNSCDDGDACTTGDGCSAGVCVGTPVSCDDGVACTLDWCDGGQCVHDGSACECIVDGDCDDGIACTAETCASGVCRRDPSACECLLDQDCTDGIACTVDLCGSDRVCYHEMRDTCCGNGLCEKGEDSCTCGVDCSGSQGPICGNGVCEAGDGEDCLTCPEDCNGDQSGVVRNRYCCGGGGGLNPITCEDSRCYDRSTSCTDASVVEPCCGNGVCEDYESGCFCPDDCGPPLAYETPGATCQDGIDNDCDTLVDCDDPDCKKESLCWSCDDDGVCEPGEDCKSCPSDCDGLSRGRILRRYCCGDGVREPAERDPSVCDGNP